MALFNYIILLFFSGGRFCSFSPCIEQTHRCCDALQANGFIEIKSIEILQIEDTVKIKTLPVMDLEFVKYKVSFFWVKTVKSDGTNHGVSQSVNFNQNNKPSLPPNIC